MPRDTLVSFIQWPERSKPRRDSVVKFREDYEEYARPIDFVNNDRTPSNRVRNAPVRECIRFDLLENVIMTDIIKDVDDITNLSDDHVKKWYESVLSKEPTNLGDKFAEIIKRVKHQPNSADKEAGVQEYMLSCMTMTTADLQGNVFDDCSADKVVKEWTE